MKKLKIKAHTCYLGKTGYNAHARGFFRELSKHVDLRIRNYTWDDNPTYLNEIDLSILDEITLSTGEHQYADFDIASHPAFSKFKFTTPKDKFEPDVDIVLMDMNHHYFYEKFTSKIRIAYTVWESTRLPGYFVDRLIENFDYVWVVSEWHKKVLSEQGYPITRIHVVNEAVDSDFFPEEFDQSFNEYQDERFKFIVFGRWDFRKSIPEIINAFLKEFFKEEGVDLILSVDNPYAVDGMNSTEERIQHYGFTDERIKIKHFVSRDEYKKYIKNGHVLVTCARSEGWNIPLIEAIASGTPSLFTYYGAQLEFAKYAGIPIGVNSLVPCLSGDTYNVQALAGTEVPGYYCAPDYEDLQRKLRYVYKNYEIEKEKSLKNSSLIRNKFTWENSAKQAMDFFKENESLEKNGKCVIILSHADNRVKEMKMNDLVNSLNQKGYTTILSSHLNEKSLADYTIIDKNNDIIDYEKAKKIGTVLPEFFFFDDNIEIAVPFEYNHGYAVLSLIKNGLGFAESLGYDNVHVINYDYYLNCSQLLDEHERFLNDYDYDYVGYEWGASDEVNTGFFSCKISSIHKLLLTIKTYKDYFDLGIHFEQFMFNFLKKHNLKFIQLEKKSPDLIISNTEILPTYPMFNLGKDNIHYSLTYEKNTNKIILSLLGNTEYPVEIRLKRNSLYKSLFITWDIIHYEISEDMLKSGIEINLPSFEKSIFLNLDNIRGYSEVKNWNSVKTLQESDFQEISSLTRKININYVNGPFVEILDSEDGEYFIEFIDQKNDKIIYSTTIKQNHWTRAGRKWYTDWKIRITDIKRNKTIHEETINLKNQRVFICFESSSLGDNLAWIGYADEFRKKHQCKLIVSSFYNDLFSNEYPDIEFVGRGVTVNNIHAMYSLGWFYINDTDKFDESRNPNDFKDQNMQKTASDILGLDFYQVKPKITIPKSERKIQEKYVCIGIHSTAQAKYWNHIGGWQKVVDFLNSQGYKVVLISKETGNYMNNIPPNNIIDKSGSYSLSERITDLYHAEFYIGLGSGLSWLAWSVGIPIFLISGFSKPYTEFEGENIFRFFNENSCNGCFNKHRLDAGDWNWCPVHKNTDRQFECTKTIQPESIISSIKKFLNSKNDI